VRPTAAEALLTLQEVATRLGHAPYDTPSLARSVAQRRSMWNDLSTLHGRMGRYEAALALNARARAMPAESPTQLAATLLTRANILAELALKAHQGWRAREASALHAEALRCFDEGLALSDSALEALGEKMATLRHGLQIGRGGELRALGRFAEADAVFAAMVDQAPTDAQALYNRAYTAWQWGQSEEFAGWRDKAIERFIEGVIHIEDARTLEPGRRAYDQLRRDLHLAALYGRATAMEHAPPQGGAPSSSRRSMAPPTFPGPPVTSPVGGNGPPLSACAVEKQARLLMHAS
jgi:tetratricopeptide (TPR) repeat protein